MSCNLDIKMPNVEIMRSPAAQDLLFLLTTTNQKNSSQDSSCFN